MLAAIGRFKTVIAKYQTTSHTPEALERLVEAYLTLGLVQEAKENAAVLGYNYPGSYWYETAYNLMSSKGYPPGVAPRHGRRGLFHNARDVLAPAPAPEPPAAAVSEPEQQGAAATDQQQPQDQATKKKHRRTWYNPLGL
jgi:outer membrane protein assembly factor BamD